MSFPTLGCRRLWPLALAALCAAPVQAGPITLTFDSLPSAQGASYLASGNSVPEGDVFTVDGTKLVQNSLGVGFAPQGSNIYNFYGAFDQLGSGFEITARARLTGENSETNHWGFAFFALDGTGAEYGFGLGSGLVITPAGEVAYDTSIFHDYRLVGRPGATPGTGAFDLFADGSLLASGSAWTLDCVALGAECNDVGLGDGTGGANASGEVTAFSFTETVTVPATWALLAPVLGLGLARTRRRRAVRAAAALGLAGALGVGGAKAGVITDWYASSGSLPDALSPAWSFGGNAGFQGQGLAGGVLTIATSGYADGWFFYQEPPLADLTAGFSIEARVRYVSGSSADPSRAPVVIAFGLGGHTGNGLYIGQDAIFLLADNLQVGASAAVDTDGAMHNYGIAYDPLTGIEVSYDGAPVLVGQIFTHGSTFGPDQSVMFGEGSILAYGTSEWEFVRNAPVPAPGVAWLVLAGLIPLARRRTAAAA